MNKGMQINSNDIVSYEQGAAIAIEEMNVLFVCNGRIAKGKQKECLQSKTALRISVNTGINTYSRVYYCETCMKSIICQMKLIR